MKMKFFSVLLHCALACGIISASSDVNHNFVDEVNLALSDSLNALVDQDSIVNDYRPYLYQDVEYITSDSIGEGRTAPVDNYDDIFLTEEEYYMIGPVGNEGVITFKNLSVTTGKQIIVNGTVNVFDKMTIANNLVISGPGNIIVDTLYISDDVTIDGLSSVIANYLYINSATRISSSTLIDVIDEVYVLGSSMVDLPSSLGNESTFVDLEFPRGVFQFFTPPFDILSDYLGTVELDQYAAGSLESVWLYRYDEASEAADESVNSWVPVGSGERLVAGKGYSIWVGNEGSVENRTIRLSSPTSYPNLTDIISPNIEYTEPATLSSGMNALGNTYSLPLLLPANDNVKAYYYHNGSKYETMAGGIIVGNSVTSSFEIPTYSSFFASVNSSSDVGFSKSDLNINSSEMRSLTSFSASPEYVRIALQSENSYDDMVLRFVEGASSDADVYDITKLFDPNSLADIEMSSTLTNGVGSYTIQSFPAIEELGHGEMLDVPLKFNVNAENEYSISSTLTNISSNEIEIFLYDDLTEKLISLDDNLQSITLSSTYDKNGRYHIKAFSGIPTSVDDDLLRNGFDVYVHDNILYIQPEHNAISGQFEVLDMYGKVLLTDNFVGDSFFSLSDLPRGIYLIRVDSDYLFSSSTKVFVE